MRKRMILLFMGLLLLFVAGCSEQTGGSKQKQVASKEIDQETVKEHNREPVHTYDVVYTLEEKLSLIFDRVLAKDEILPILDQLDTYDIKATFFGSEEQLKEYPEAVEEIIARGHMIENHAFSGKDIEDMDNEELFYQIEQVNEQITIHTGTSANYIYLKGRVEHEKVNAVAGKLGMDGVIHYSSRLTEQDDKERLKLDARRAVARGGIIALNPKEADVLSYFIEAVEDVDFTFVTLNELIDLDKERKPFEEIPGAEAIQMNANMNAEEPVLHEREETEQKEVALTFDDWASEAVVLEVLNLLDRYEIQSTFYLKTNRVHQNPNLARLLVERGHEVANHTHSHYDSTEITMEELQEDVYEAHQIITEAIQEQPTLYFRPPFGRIDDASAQAIAAMGFEALGLYDLSSYDWNEEYTEQDVIDRVMTGVQPGSVIVMHILDNIHTPSVLEDVIVALQEEGYEFVLTSDWIEEK